MGHIQSFIILIARLAIASLFIMSGVSKILHWNQMLQYMATHGMQMTEFFLFGATCIEIGIGLLIALGWHMKAASWILALYLIPLTYLFHNFWDISEPSMKEIQCMIFFKNLAIWGGLLALTCVSAGKYSIDRK